MKYMKALLLPLLASCFLSKANTFFITNRSGYEVVVEFWRKEKKEDFFKLPKNSMIDITGHDKGFGPMPREYKLRFVYLDKDKKIVHTDTTFFLVTYLAQKEIILQQPKKSVAIIAATREMILAVERNLNFTGFDAIPFWIGGAQELVHA